MELTDKTKLSVTRPLWTDLAVVEEDLVLATLVIFQTLFVEGPVKTWLQS